MAETQGSALNLKEQSPIRNLKVGEVFKPFEGRTGFPIVELDEEEVQRIMTMPFQFKGINGRLTVITTPEADEISDNPLNPLGEAHPLRILENGRYKTEKMPLSLELDFEVISMEEFHMLQKYALEFVLGDEKYYLRCGGADSERAVKANIVTEGKMNLFDGRLRREGVHGIALLPYDIGKLAQIEAKMVKKEISPYASSSLR